MRVKWQVDTSLFADTAPRKKQRTSLLRFVFMRFISYAAIAARTSCVTADVEAAVNTTIYYNTF